jgi:hypothetical protein
VATLPVPFGVVSRLVVRVMLGRLQRGPRPIVVLVLDAEERR